MLNHDDSFLGILKNFEQELDPVLREMRTNEQVNRNKGFVFPLLLKSLFNTAILKQAAGFKAKLVTILPLPILAGSGVLTFFQPEQVVGWLCFGLAYLLSVIQSFSRMTTLGDPDFHYKAYSAFRKKETELFQFYVRNPHFSFGAFYDGLQRRLLERQQDGLQQIDLVTERFVAQHRMLESRIQELEAAIAERDQDLEYYEQAVDVYERETAQLEGQVRYLTELISRSVQILSRIHQGRFSFSDLRILSDFSLYELQGNRLKLVAEAGTSTPAEILLADSRHFGWASLRALQVKGDEATVQHLRPGRMIVSKKLLLPDGEVWVYNLHLNESDPYSEYLTKGDILETNELYRLVHVVCLHLQVMRRVKEAGSDGH